MPSALLSFSIIFYYLCKMKDLQLTDFLPTSKKEAELRGWDTLDVILFSGDAYVDHPSFGAAVIGRLLEAEGLKVAIVPQPNWRDDLRDFKKLGKPNLFFAISAGSMDSMVNHYTANKRRRSNDAYTAGGIAGQRPDYATITYSNILKKLYPDVPIVIGGIEASLRRFTHYDYWQDKLMPSILIDSHADLMTYGMGEQPTKAIVRALKNGIPFSQLTNIPQTSYVCNFSDFVTDTNDVVLYSHEECCKDKIKQAKNFKLIEEDSNRIFSQRLVQKVGDKMVIVNPKYETMSSEELDQSYEFPYTRVPHLRYKGKIIPAYEMIKFSINLHRGCFGGCSFCTISAHQGKQIVSRTKDSVLREIKLVSQLPDFKGYLSDLGGPSANMYQLGGKNKSICQKCVRPSCLHPRVCKNLCTDLSPLLDLYQSVDHLSYIKKSFIGSGVRYDILLHESDNEKENKSHRIYTEELIKNHVSGRLKVAPEHTSDQVLYMMRKPSFELFHKFKEIFEKINQKNQLNQQIIPYFISSHPGCLLADMAELAVETKSLNFQLEQVQDFTPTPMTLSTEMYYTGLDPYTLKPIKTAKTQNEKLEQRKFFFWYLSENRNEITKLLKRINRNDLINKLFARNDRNKKFRKN